MTPYSIWPQRIYQTNVNIPSQSVCSAMCTLVSVNCQLYVYVANTGTCYFGNFATVSAGVTTAPGGSEVVNTRIDAIGNPMILAIN